MDVQPEARPKKVLVTPAAADPCPCGSGRTFAKCCHPNLAGSASGQAVRNALLAHDLPAALIAARADIAQYVIWHRTNTEPLLRLGHPVGEELLDIDVKALAECVDELVQIHWLMSQAEMLMGVLERLRDAIRSPRWNRKITYFQAKTEEVANDNPEAARREFNKLLPISRDEDDVGVLQTCISLYGTTLSFSQVIGVCDHILRLSPALSDRLQYTSVKAGRYLLIDDVQQAGRLYDEAAAMARAAREERGLNPYENWLLSLTLSHLGLLKREPELFDEAIAILKDQLATPGWKPVGLERLHKLVGDCHRFAGRWAEAETAYRSAIAAVAASEARIFLAEVIMRQGRTSDAALAIDGIAPDALDRYEYEDYVFGLAAIAVETGERTRMLQAVRRLEGFEASAPYFERRRLLLLLRVKQAAEQGRTAKGLRSIRRLMATTARSISRYSILEPNISGVGVNLNRALDDLADRLDPPAAAK
jgi:tetratricopeptide (TPR) repeat protein